MEQTNVNLGITLGIIAGILVGSFALPMKKIKTWQWEHTWVMFSFWGTILLPIILAFITVPHLISVFSSTPFRVLFVVFLFGAVWGVANIGYGIGLKMVGLALGTVLVLGLNNAIGALLPIFLYSPDKIMQPVGLTIIIGVIVMIAGIIVCAIAGMKREKVQTSRTITTDRPDTKSLFLKGFIICLVAGVLAAMFNFALIKGKPMEIIVVKMGVAPVNASNPTWVVALSGGFIVTLAYCIYLFRMNKNWNIFFASGTRINWIYTLLMGLMWYGGVAIYGMSVSKLGVLGASIGWSIIQSVAVGSGNFWGMVTGEWKGVGKTPVLVMIGGLILLFIGIVIVGYAGRLD